ncbi:MAG TPA: DUF5946 family protein [Gemmatimonadaceae bacterium]
MTAARCAECGAELPEAGACIALFHELLALEAQVVGGPGEVPHFLAVATYNLQHPSAFTLAALAGLRRAVADVLDGSATIAEVRRRAGAGARGATRVKRRSEDASTRSEDAPRSRWPTHWPSTVRDVCRLAPEQYIDHVTAWARDTVRTLDQTLGASPRASE